MPQMPPHQRSKDDYLRHSLRPLVPSADHAIAHRLTLLPNQPALAAAPVTSLPSAQIATAATATAIVESAEPDPFVTSIASITSHQQMLAKFHKRLHTRRTAQNPCLEVVGSTTTEGGVASIPVLTSTVPSSPPSSRSCSVSPPDPRSRPVFSAMAGSPVSLADPDLRDSCSPIASQPAIPKPSRQLTSLLERELAWLAPFPKPFTFPRSEVIKLMYRLAQRRSFKGETVYMAMNLHDRYLATARITMQKQGYLLGLTCMYIAAKILEEMREPLTTDVIHGAAHRLIRNDVKRMERKVMAALALARQTFA
eukprot:jgi/Hompol1/5431/HPOL_004434-RA